MGGGVFHCRSGVGRCWPRKAVRQCVYCAVLSLCLIREVKGRQEGDGCHGMGFRMSLLAKGKKRKRLRYSFILGSFPTKIYLSPPVRHLPICGNANFLPFVFASLLSLSLFPLVSFHLHASSSCDCIPQILFHSNLFLHSHLPEGSPEEKVIFVAQTSC